MTHRTISKMASWWPAALLLTASLILCSCDAAVREKKVVVTFELVNGTFKPVVRQVEEETDAAALSGRIIQVTSGASGVIDVALNVHNTYLHIYFFFHYQAIFLALLFIIGFAGSTMLFAIIFSSNTLRKIPFNVLLVS